MIWTFRLFDKKKQKEMRYVLDALLFNEMAVLLFLLRKAETGVSPFLVFKRAKHQSYKGRIKKCSPSGVLRTEIIEEKGEGNKFSWYLLEPFWIFGGKVITSFDYQVRQACGRVS